MELRLNFCWGFNPLAILLLEWDGTENEENQTCAVPLWGWGDFLLPKKKLRGWIFFGHWSVPCARNSSSLADHHDLEIFTPIHCETRVRINKWKADYKTHMYPWSSTIHRASFTFFRYHLFASACVEVDSMRLLGGFWDMNFRWPDQNLCKHNLESGPGAQTRKQRPAGPLYCFVDHCHIPCPKFAYLLYIWGDWPLVHRGWCTVWLKLDIHHEDFLSPVLFNVQCKIWKVEFNIRLVIVGYFLIYDLCMIGKNPSPLPARESNPILLAT
jgi:hypothetical protein